jgi:UDP-3-O-[3-hydroxymyristoyl] glucosamine N-acyltransferase
MDITTYPDSWIRDLPLVKAGRGVYLANRCVVGTNLCLNDGSILVGKCTFGDGAMIGHLAMFGLGTSIGKQSELGVKAALGLHITVDDNVQVGPGAEVNHGTHISSGARIGTSAVIGIKCRIGENITIKPGASIPPGAVILTQDEADKYFSSETFRLSEHKKALFEVLMEQMSHGPAPKSG